MFRLPRLPRLAVTFFPLPRNSFRHLKSQVPPNPGHYQVRLRALAVLKNVGKIDSSVMEEHLALVLPCILDAQADRNGSVKAKAERALRYCLNLNHGTKDFAQAWLKRPEAAKVKSRLNEALLQRTSRLPDFSDADCSDTEN